MKKYFDAFNNDDEREREMETTRNEGKMWNKDERENNLF
jgi:hypothetical protein